MLELIGRAQAQLGTGNIQPIKPLTSGDLPTIIVNIVNVVLWVAGLLAVVYLIYGGILYITAGGDPEKATKGRTAIINAVIGVVIIIVSLLILSYVKSKVGGGGSIVI